MNRGLTRTMNHDGRLSLTSTGSHLRSHITVAHKPTTNPKADNTLKTRIIQHKVGLHCLTTLHYLDSDHQFVVDEAHIIEGKFEENCLDTNSINRYITLDHCYTLIKERLKIWTILKCWRTGHASRPTNAPSYTKCILSLSTTLTLKTPITRYGIGGSCWKV